MDGLSDDDHTQYVLVSNMEADRATIATNWDDLTDAGDSTLHYHASDRALANATGTLALANGGTGASLADPNADRILFWDDSAGVITWLTAGSGLTITDTTMTASGSGGGSKAYAARH